MSSSDGMKLFKKNAAEWAMSIFYESVNEVYGFMPRYMYNFLIGKDVLKDDKTYIYMPEKEFFERATSGNTILNFEKIYVDSMAVTPNKTPWLEKIKYRSILSKQLDLNPSNCINEMDVHLRRKILVSRWFQSLVPYYENYELACNSFFPGVISSATSKLESSVALLSARDAELGLNDLAEISSAIKNFK